MIYCSNYKVLSNDRGDLPEETCSGHFLGGLETLHIDRREAFQRNGILYMVGLMVCNSYCIYHVKSDMYDYVGLVRRIQTVSN